LEDIVPYTTVRSPGSPAAKHTTASCTKLPPLLQTHLLNVGTSDVLHFDDVAAESRQLFAAGG
jgi:hypothetical protein